MVDGWSFQVLPIRARAPDGLLLYRPFAIEGQEGKPDADDKHYLVLRLVDGDLEVKAAAGKAELKLRTNGTRFDDGRLYSVRLIRAHKQLELWVDEEKVAGGTLAGNAYPARARGLFIGGAGEEGAEVPDFAAPGFTGTVADFIVDAQLVGFESAVNWSSARLGRAHAPPPARPAPRALQAAPGAADAGCTKTSSYTVEAGAVKFGDARWSHAAVRLPPKAKELVITLQLRTFRPEGLLLLLPGSKAKPKHYLALMIREGKLRLVARGRRRRELTLDAYVADGTWTPVTVRVSRSRLSLSSGSAAATAHAPALARAHRLLVGGLSAPPAPHTLPNSIVRAGGLVGCVRRVAVNGRAEDLARAQHAGGQCFPNIEQAAYFAGDAYATWAEAWTPGEGAEAAELRLQFRTGSPGGVLLAARGLLLELEEGAVVLTRYSAGGAERGRVEARGAGGRALCDGAWHVLSARAASLSIDAGPELRAAPSSLHDAGDPPSAPAPLYIGGLPEGTTDWADGGRENFKGCIRDVTIGAHKRDWRDMHALRGVLLDSCPIAQ
ncbi:laminin subunit alpha-1-like [Ostrinia furnacalis]|uniref:laminin subunit alpha-1-like n=1 Tax=Ostrinia furnacalis TaxID=93504 RepID=UPI001038F24E|nr:laminin subunit alpha-1-like [Ostrinia furnacalis]